MGIEKSWFLLPEAFLILPLKPTLIWSGPL